MEAEDGGLRIAVDRLRCDGCGLCLSACPFLAISLEPRDPRDEFESPATVAVIAASCTECEICLPSCPTAAITSRGLGSALESGSPEADQAGQAAGEAGVWVLVGPDGAGLGLGRLARKVADEWECLVTGLAVRLEVSADADWPPVLRAADEVRTLELPCQILQDATATARVLADTLGARRPRLIVASADVWGRRVLPALAAILDGAFAGPVADLEVSFGSEAVTAVAVTHAGRVATRLMASGNRVLVASVRPTPGERRAEPAHGRWTAARILCGAGAGLGLGNPEERERLGERLTSLASLLGAAVGMTRECVDAGWAPGPGATVIDRGTGVFAPLLYLAFGIDGNPGHDAAVAHSGFIVAATPNKDAPLALSADYVIPAPPAEVLDAFLRVVQEISPEK